MLMALCFAGLAISGIIIYISPPCSIAERTGWTIAGLNKDQWASLHQVTALFILILALIHLFVFNWKTFLIYLRERRNRFSRYEEEGGEGRQGSRMRLPREFILALIVALILYAGAITMIAPFGWLHDGHDAIRDHYRKQAQTTSVRDEAGDRSGEQIRRQSGPGSEETIRSEDRNEDTGRRSQGQYQGQGQGQYQGQGQGQYQSQGQGQYQGQGQGQDQGRRAVGEAEDTRQAGRGEGRRRNITEQERKSQ